MSETRDGRRQFLAYLVAFPAVLPIEAQQSQLKKGRSFPAMAARYADPATEFPLLRLTDLQFSSRLPVSDNRLVTSKGMLFASDLAGAWQAFWMEFKNRAPRQLTDAAALDLDSLALAPAARAFWHFDGPSLFETNLSNLKAHEIYRLADGNRRTSRVCFNETGTHAVFAESSLPDNEVATQSFRLRLLDLAKGTASTVIESNQPIDSALLRPHHDLLVYRTGARSGGKFHSVHFDGREATPLPLADGDIPHVQWAADGSTLLYLSRPADPKKLTSLREWTPESGADAQIATTTQFVTFQANLNASIFIGSSGSKASPYLLLLTRAGKRELTLAEHHASNPRAVAPQFSPNSLFVVFSSDRQGKPAIYWMAVDKLVAETDEG